MARMYKDPTQHLDRMSEGAVGARAAGAASQSRLRAHSTANSAPNTTTFAAA